MTVNQVLGKNITPFSDSLSKVKRLREVDYDWRTDKSPSCGFTKKRKFSLIAQEVEKVISELVNTEDEGYKAVSYEKLAPLLVERSRKNRFS